jgi:hypothetical protein
MLSANESLRKQRSETYYQTGVRDDGATADLTKEVVVISGSVVAATLGTKYKATAKGVVVLAPAVLPAMAMSASSGFGTLTGQTRLKIVTTGSSLSAGFTANTLVPVYGSGATVGWGTPTAKALKIAVTADGNTARATVFRYLTGAAMTGGYVAPGRRVGAYLPTTTALSASGWKLIDSAVAHGANLPDVPAPIASPPPPAPPPL